MALLRPHSHPVPDGLLHILQRPLGLFKLVAGLLGSWWGQGRRSEVPLLPARKRGKGMPKTRQLPPAPGPALGEDRAQEDPVGLASPRADPTPLPGLSAP